MPASRVSLIVLLLALLMPLAAAQAQEWDTLDPAERQVLQPFAAEWAQLGSDERERLRLSARRWLDMPAEERQRLAERMAFWQSLSPEDRELLRQQRAQRREQGDHGRERALRRRFDSLPEAQREEALRKFRALSQEERRAFLAGAALARRDQREHLLMAGLDPGERPLLRQKVAQLQPDLRRRLIRHMGGLPPAERLALAQEVIASKDVAALADLVDQRVGPADPPPQR